MANSDVYTEEQLKTLKENNEALSLIAKRSKDKFLDGGKVGDGRLAIEAITSSNDSIHKQAKINATLEGNKENSEQTKDLVAAVLKAANMNMYKSIPGATRNIESTEIDLPLDTVPGEMEIGNGYLDIEDIIEVELVGDDDVVK